MSGHERHYTTNIQKGGALIRECRILLLEWLPTESIDQFLERVSAQNVLGKLSRRRVRDIVKRIFKPRFTATGTPGAMPVRRLLESGVAPAVVDRVFYYHTALADHLLYDFAGEFLNRKHSQGGYGVSITEAEEFLLRLQRSGQFDRPWSPATRTKVARGLLAACRDFHVLEGAVRKHLAPVALPMEVFVYVAYYLKERVVSASRMIEHPDWRLFFLNHRDVEHMFLRAHQEDWLKYNAAGHVVRVDWHFSNHMEAVDALAQRAHSYA
ncbi:MAG: DUF1819 family protein [Acidobacteriia bacterium]|nr:DUF1819 family protein [Terriglobia bacterium]